MRKKLAKTKRWVVKIGSALLTNDGQGLNKSGIASWVAQLAALRAQGLDIILVSSGSVAVGMRSLGWEQRPSSVRQLQAAAAVGQMGLVNAYQREFDKLDIKAAQVLISHDDISNRKRYLNARRSLETLLELNVIPIVNENDSVATEEISFGDNDTLAGALVGLVGADKFIMLTDQVGICSGDPTKDSNVNLLSEIDLDDPSIDLSSQLEGSSGQVGRGGMKTKIQASRIALAAGAKTWVADGRQENTLKAIFNNEKIGTILLSQRSQRQSRKTWIASLGSPAGSVCLDNGAVLAVNKKGSSLLAAGIIKVSGDFDTGALIVCEDENGQEIARGLTNLNSKDIDLVKGLNSKELLEKLDQAADEEIIHRNNLILSYRVLTFLFRRDFILAALFLCITFLLAKLSRALSAFLKAPLASSLSLAETALSTAFTAVLAVDLCVLLRAFLFTFCLALLIADFIFAICLCISKSRA